VRLVAHVDAVAGRLWRRGDVLRAALGAGLPFPHRVVLPRLRGRDLASDFARVRADIEDLQARAAGPAGGGSRIEYREIATRVAGAQRVPAAVVFERPADLAAWLGKDRDYADFERIASLAQADFPALRDWLLDRPSDALATLADWPRFSAVVRYLATSHRPGVFVRQLDIPGVDTKFIESNRALLRAMLDCALPEAAIDRTIATLANGGFERRFGLAVDPPAIRFRLLDPSLSPWPGIDDFAVPPTQADRLRLPISRAFIVENKMNLLTFPPVERAVVLVGQGYRARILGDLEWLRRCEVHYWGDIDTHGFAILSMLRVRLPQVRSLLMDERTLLEHRPLWVAEPEQQRVRGDLEALEPQDAAMFRALRDNRYGEGVRLEQERIGQSFADRAIADRVSSPDRVPGANARGLESRP
jgi:hypothetical protein